MISSGVLCCKDAIYKGLYGNFTGLLYRPKMHFGYLQQTRKIPIQTLVKRIFATQHRSKARVTFAHVSFTCHLIISSHLALGRPVVAERRFATSLLETGIKSDQAADVFSKLVLNLLSACEAIRA